MYYIDPGSLGTNAVYCDMTLDGGGWTLVYINNNPSNLETDNTSAQGNTASLTSLDASSAKFSDAFINAIKENTDNRIGYRVTSNDISNRYFSPSSCEYSHTDNGNTTCRRYTASYTTSTSPSYTQCADWGGGSGGLDAWYSCGSYGGGYTNVFNTHRVENETSGITTNSSGAYQGGSSTSYGNDVLMWVR